MGLLGFQGLTQLGSLASFVSVMTHRLLLSVFPRVKSWWVLDLRQLINPTFDYNEPVQCTHTTFSFQHLFDFSNVSSNRLPQKRQSHIGCIWLRGLYSELTELLSSVFVNFVPEFVSDFFSRNFVPQNSDVQCTVYSHNISLSADLPAFHYLTNYISHSYLSYPLFASFGSNSDEQPCKCPWISSIYWAQVWKCDWMQKKRSNGTEKRKYLTTSKLFKIW